ncbi:heavy metal transport/detoxification superfamily protein [Actinidia rufa]|uniref:Heavy metal transport/detoxification superfamily protein n=1 Tax=Actinidia rufa TaxID=165716 RepID=A0A7J0FXM6_9ERIC|nr:heavy metal transport/detoxification superfamily protein [Actinidia rufa]
MADKVTIMVLKVVDLHCYSCYKKIKKVLCKFPEIRNQVYDEKANTVTITVVCCNPEKIRDKLCCKGGKTITKIDIKRPPTPTPTPTQTQTPTPNPAPPVPNPPAPPTPVLVGLWILLQKDLLCEPVQLC